MTKPLKKRDRNVLFSLVEFRVLSAAQIALLEGMNSRSVRRLMKRYLELGILETIERSFSGSKGRPESLFCLSRNGIDLLKNDRLFDPFITYENIVWEGRQSLEHQIGVNWILIHAKILARFVGVKSDYISHTSPFHPESESGAPFIHDYVHSSDNPNKPIGFTPDAVLVLENSQQQKSLLFFVEYDRSTEPLVGSKTNSIAQKIQNYRSYFQHGGYKRYEKTFKYPFQGFRLLFITDSKERRLNLCRLVHDRKPSDFIWVTGIDEIKAHGIGANIWNRGGDIHTQEASIIGRTLAFDMADRCP